ncbi:DUF3787 domain-containing protein [Oscillospiraceae bacterium OttesenSCG-928-G22]|nr:DUF3787 domain-containing protein [Oscillospiraceae bacterium OttesenSCG-928-G22]
MDGKNRKKSGIPPTPAIAPDKKRKDGGAPLANDESVKEAKDWVDDNRL